MCDLIREHQPHATIVVGGHIANHPRLSEWIDADHIVRGEGVRWFREYLGEDAHRPIRHPLILSAVETRTLGVRLPQGSGDMAATLIPSVGCPLGCNFCSTSAMFGGKGRSVDFYETGRRAVRPDVRLRGGDARALLLHHGRELPAPPEARPAAPGADARPRQGVVPLRVQLGERAPALHDGRTRRPGRLLGLDGPRGQGSAYDKLKGIDTRSLVDTLQSNGIRVLGSTIIGLEEHTPENIDEVIDHAVGHDTDFHQFMLYTPLPGTPLHAEHLGGGTLMSDDECPPADTHGQLRFNFRHPHIRNGEEIRVPPARVRARFRAERSEHPAHRPHAAPGVAEAQGPSRCPGSRAVPARMPGPAHGLRGDPLGRRAMVPGKPRAGPPDRRGPRRGCERVWPARPTCRPGDRHVPAGRHAS